MILYLVLPPPSVLEEMLIYVFQIKIMIIICIIQRDDHVFSISAHINIIINIIPYQYQSKNMLGDMFDTPDELLSGAKEGNLLSSWDRKPRNCADLLQMPDLARKKGYPIGLKNQGATCYLNSLLQILFHTPQLRKMILELPLCEEQLGKKTSFVSQSKHKFLLGFQRLFSQMSLSDVNSLSTEYLNEALGWQGNEHMQQQDIQQAMRVIFDTFERALVGTAYQQIIKGLFKGLTAKFKSCRNCTVSTEKVEQFCDLMMRVKDIPSLQESLMNFLTAQAMEGDNKIFCETCNSNQDMWLGSKLKVLPNILVFTLNRFDFDYQKMDRVKINDFFSFDLSYRFDHLFDQNSGDHEYQLYGVLIHMGSAHGGHYICYVRDILQESDWSQSLKDAEQRNKKQLEQRTKDELLTEEQRKRRQESEKQNKVYHLKEPQNKQLLQNWFEINDGVATGINAQKITSQYQGSASAYILFYRKKSFTTQKESIKVPEYYAKGLVQTNQNLKTLRKEYQNEKQHIILKINGKDQKLNVNLPIITLIQQFVPKNSTLVMESIHNNLPYYRMELKNDQTASQIYKKEDTIKSLQIYHESQWKTYQLSSQDYLLNIKPAIGKDRLPFQVNILYQGNNKKCVFYQDQNFLMFRLKIENLLKVSYQKQIIKLVTPYKQIFVTDDITNDDLLLTKLGFVHECQAILKSLQKKQEQNDDQIEDVPNKKDTNLYCFIIERDDIIGIKRIYFQKEKTLQDLLEFVMKSQGLADQKRRFRNLNGNRLYYVDHYSKKLSELSLEEEMIKYRIQKGEIPIKGDICVKVKVQSKYYPQFDVLIEKIFDPNTLVTQVKKTICDELKLDANLHKFYLTDWMGQPVRSLTKQKQSIFEANFSREETVCLRDLQSPIGSELVHFEVYITETGSPDNISSTPILIKIEEFKTALDLKHLLLETPPFSEKQLNHKRLRVRELKRDYMFGFIWRENNKQIKNLTINSNKIVVQIMAEDEELNQEQIVIIVKERNVEKRIYQKGVELIFNAGKAPTMIDLKSAIKEKLKIQDQILIMKYFNYNFEWVEISQKNIEDFAKGKKKPTQKGQNKKKNKDQKQQKQQKHQNHEKKVEIKKQETQNNEIITKKQQTADESIKTENKEEKSQATQKKKDNQQNKEKPAQKQKKTKKNQDQTKNNESNLQKTLEQCLNLRKAPVLLKDGDWIGFGNANLITSLKDDLQTDEDLSLRLIKDDNKSAKYRPKDMGKGFKVNVDF